MKAKILNLHRLLCYVFRLSYIGLTFDRERLGSYSRWNEVKNRLDIKICEAVLSFIGESDLSLNGINGANAKQLVLDSISEIVSMHYSGRLKIHSLSGKMPFCSKRTFVTLSVLHIYFLEVRSMFSGIAKLRSRYNFDHSGLSKSIDISVGFPCHSFSILSAEDKVCGNESLSTYHSSFGEYLLMCSKSSYKCETLISIDESVRKSKKNEKNALYSKLEGISTTEEYPRVNSQLEKSWKIFLKQIPNATKLVCQLVVNVVLRRKSLLLEIIYCKKWLKGHCLGMVVDQVAQRGSTVRKIYILPYGDVGLLKYQEISPIVVTYNYSQNVFTPPASLESIKSHLKSAELNKVLLGVPIWVFRLHGHAVGYTDVFSLVNKMKVTLNQKFNYKLPLSNIVQTQQLPVLLGFEHDLYGGVEGNKHIVAVFDVPPESVERQLSRSILGDRTSDFMIVEKYLVDVTDACVAAGFNVVFKPKYSLTNYSNEYRDLLDRFSIKYKNNFKIVNPYTSVLSLLSSACACITIPYTSILYVAYSVGLPSVYYIPELYRESFSFNLKNENLVIGESELAVFLLKVYEKQQT